MRQKKGCNLNPSFPFAMGGGRLKSFPYWIRWGWS